MPIQNFYSVMYILPIYTEKKHLNSSTRINNSNINKKQMDLLCMSICLWQTVFYCNMAHILRRSLLSHLPSNQSSWTRGETLLSNEKTETMMGK